MNMRISRFVHVISQTELWDAINKKIIELEPTLVLFIKDNKNNFNIKKYPKELETLGIVVKEEEELERIKKLAEQTTDKQFQSLYLITTTNCNLDCSYCFYRSSFSGSLKHRQNMSYEVAKKAIDKFFDIVSKNVVTDNYWQQITFYGGEPLINKQMLMKAIPYAREKFNDKYTSLVINTNLVLLDKDIINLFKENNVEVQVSLDGNREQHDLNRKNVAGQGSYDIVIKNMKILIKNGIKVLPMITATDANINNFNETLWKIVKELNVDDYAVNILITNSFETNSEYTLTLSKEMLKAFKKFGNIANDYSFVELYEMLLGKDKTIAKNSCGCTRKITIFPNGEVYSCQAMEKLDINKMGEIDTDFINNPNWELWKKRNKFYNEECLNCEVVASCGGGCATGSYNGTGTIYGIDYNQCHYTKNLFKQLIKDRNENK